MENDALRGQETSGRTEPDKHLETAINALENVEWPVGDMTAAEGAAIQQRLIEARKNVLIRTDGGENEGYSEHFKKERDIVDVEAQSTSYYLERYPQGGTVRIETDAEMREEYAAGVIEIENAFGTFSATLEADELRALADAAQLIANLADEEREK